MVILDVPRNFGDPAYSIVRGLLKVFKKRGVRTFYGVNKNKNIREHHYNHRRSN